MIHPINSGIIMRACFELWDDQERGTSKEVLQFIRPKYQRCLDQLMTEGLPDDQAIPRNIHIMICRSLKNQGYWKPV